MLFFLLLQPAFGLFCGRLRVFFLLFRARFRFRPPTTLVPGMVHWFSPTSGSPPYLVLNQPEGAHKKNYIFACLSIFSWPLRPTIVPGVLVHAAYVWHPWCCFFCFFSQRLVYFASRGPRKLNFGMPHCFDPTKRKMFLKIKVFVCGHLWVFSAFKS